MGWKQAKVWLFWGWSLKNPIFTSTGYVCVLISEFLWVDKFVLTKLCKDSNGFITFCTSWGQNGLTMGWKRGKIGYFFGWFLKNCILPSTRYPCVLTSEFSWIDNFFFWQKFRQNMEVIFFTIFSSLVLSTHKNSGIRTETYLMEGKMRFSRDQPQKRQFLPHFQPVLPPGVAESDKNHSNSCIT